MKINKNLPITSLRFIKSAILFGIFTLITQVGGLSYLMSKWINHKWKNKKRFNWQNGMVHLGTYLILTFILVPLLAPIFGRQALPLFGSDNIRPLTLWTCFLNRQYVSEDLYHCTMDISNEFRNLYPENNLYYLDANFPFMDGFPLLPHLSHSDGKKLDMAFQYDYRDKGNQKACNEVPTFIGYGSAEIPKEGEENTVEMCRKKGAWQYDILYRTIGCFKNDELVISSGRTKSLVNIIASQRKVQKIFIEPHLKQRLQLNNEKIRFHGCHAVSHDDHIHFQVH